MTKEMQEVMQEREELYEKIRKLTGMKKDKMEELNRLANEQITEDMDAEEIQAIEEKILREF